MVTLEAMSPRCALSVLALMVLSVLLFTACWVQDWRAAAAYIIVLFAVVLVINPWNWRRFIPGFHGATLEQRVVLLTVYMLLWSVFFAVVNLTARPPLSGPQLEEEMPFVLSEFWGHIPFWPAVVGKGVGDGISVNPPEAVGGSGPLNSPWHTTALPVGVGPEQPFLTRLEGIYAVDEVRLEGGVILRLVGVNAAPLGGEVGQAAFDLLQGYRQEGLICVLVAAPNQGYPGPVVHGYLYPFNQETEPEGVSINQRLWELGLTFETGGSDDSADADLDADLDADQKPLWPDPPWFQHPQAGLDDGVAPEGSPDEEVAPYLRPGIFEPPPLLETP